jgi:hypothetical protein
LGPQVLVVAAIIRLSRKTEPDRGRAEKRAVHNLGAR